MKYSRDMEALLTLAALSTYLRHGMRCDHMSAFSDFATRLEGVEHPDQPITASDLMSWFKFNKLVLRDRLKLGPAGLKRWFEGLTADLVAFPSQDIVLELLNDLNMSDIQKLSPKLSMHAAAA